MDVIDNLKKAVIDRDNLNATRRFHEITGFCRRALFHSDKEAMKTWYSKIHQFLIWFFRDQTSEWPEFDRRVGGLEMLHSLMGNFLETHSLEEITTEIKENPIMSAVLKELSLNEHGMKFTDLSERDMPGINETLARLEKFGALYRSGTCPEIMCLYLTPKGKGIAADIFKTE